MMANMSDACRALLLLSSHIIIHTKLLIILLSWMINGDSGSSSETLSTR
jgi:hypothetical protein